MNQTVPIHQLLYSTLRIEAQLSENKISVGTGFIVMYEQDGLQYLFLVTNKHVIHEAKTAKFFFTKADTDNNPLLGQRFDINVVDFDKSWYFHPLGEDIAISPIAPWFEQITKMGEKIYFRSIPLSLIPTKEQEEKLTALEEIIFIGYPNTIYDRKNLLPIIRKGITATPLSVDYEGKPMFLIDASVFQGSSGSPVFIYNFGSYSTADGNVIIGNRIHFVGIVTQVLSKKEHGIIEFEEIPTANVPVVKIGQMLDLGIVIKPKVIVETIESFLNQRKQQLKVKEGTTQDGAPHQI
ncbi:MAG: serine protease [Nanoarchaeota archaeon]